MAPTSDTAAPAVSYPIRVLVSLEAPWSAQVATALADAGPARFSVHVASPDEADHGHVEAVDLFILDAASLDARLAHGDMPVLALTTDGSVDLARARALGANDLITTAELGTAALSRAVRQTVEQSRTLAALTEARANHDLLLDATYDGTWEWDVRGDQVHYSPRCATLFGIRNVEGEHGGESWFGRVHPDDLPGLRDNLTALIEGRVTVHQYEHRIARGDGSYMRVLSRGLARRDARGEAISLAGSFTDINRRKPAEDQSVPSTRNDELTGLPSRRVLHSELEQAIKRTHADAEHKFSVLFLNLDRFKVLNDSIGLDSADQVLTQLARRLQATVSGKALVCRYGGDEFAILLDALEQFDEADTLAEAIHEDLRRQPFEIDGQTIFTTASIGIANSDRNYERPAEVIRDAGVATSRAKRHGKSQSSTFDKTMRQEALNTLRTQMQLREAIVRQQFEVYYQPIVSLASSKLTGFEALVRWNHPKRGIIGPIEFIALAEETGLIVPIGQFVLKQACTQMAAWHAKYDEAKDVSISVNLSGHQLNSPTLVAEIEAVLAETALPPSAVKLELTESTLIDDPTSAQRILKRLRDRGIQLYIDDFGTGYSSLSYLHRFAIDGLKIDKSFVDMVGRDDRKAAIVPSIVGLAHNLGVGVVAEGVETRDQAQTLALLDCAEAQGYLYSRPVPQDQAAKLIERKILG
ncbi:hypothetical protein PPSIR1_08781 [Plesiocystis pacifica SIR-1]|uniref:Uncharacterized protein n=1 Tax=Plesiocystis pacifica SIR-1 TaxID=391625 RepID=A6G7D3_9BACT|nr:EAL domain-containing protein [Plesiocystis pacifica]EDM78267.1 hypothetical protein PPSIR1_08781 [Plesiocystis pacifica SIR-1]